MISRILLSKHYYNFISHLSKDKKFLPKLSNFSCIFKYGLEDSEGIEGTWELVGIYRCAWGLTRCLLFVCIGFGGDVDIGGEPAEPGWFIDDIKRSGGGNICWPPPGNTEEGRKLLCKPPTAAIPDDIVLGNPGIEWGGVLDPDDDDFLTSPCLLTRFITADDAGTRGWEVLSELFLVPVPK